MSCCAAGAETVVGFQDNLADQARLEELRASGHLRPDGTVHYNLSVPTIHCGQCLATIERSLAALPGVVSARANLSLRRLAVVLDSKDRSPRIVIDRLAAIGYPATPLSLETNDSAETRELLKALAVAGFAAANIMLLSVSVWSGADGATRDLFHLISALIAVPAVLWAGRPFYRSAFAALRGGRFNMDVPISLAVLLSLATSVGETLAGAEEAWFDASVTLLFFLLIGRALNSAMRAKARDSVSRLGRLSAKGAFVVEGDAVAWHPLDELAPGMRLRIAAGDRLPVNGRIVEGRGEFDRSLVTGESAPIAFGPGDVIEAGALNLNGSIDLVATSDARTSFLADIRAMIEAAEHGRSAYVRIADRLARLYAPAVHIAAATAFVVWLVATGGDWHRALLVAISVLIITCPCALGLAVPVAHVIAAARMFGLGILMKDGSALERLAEANRALFDKTGTLTDGRPMVVACEIDAPAERAHRRRARRAFAPPGFAGAGRISRRCPAGRNRRHYRSCRLRHRGPVRRAHHAPRPLRLGRRNRQRPAELGNGVAFAIAGAPLRRIALREKLRPGAETIAGQLRQLGIESEIVSGDNAEAVRGVGASCAIASWSAGMPPAGKIARLKLLQQEGHRCLAVGDGLNDSPVLAAADVSFAPAEASDISRHAADFVFTRADLGAIAAAIRLARATSTIVRQNFALAIAYNLVAVPLAFAGEVSPLIAAARDVDILNRRDRQQLAPALDQCRCANLARIGGGACWPRMEPVPMSGLAITIPVALGLGLLGLLAFLWSLRTGQYDDLDGAAERILEDDDRPDPA